mgnify:CR=1 FL=1
MNTTILGSGTSHGIPPIDCIISDYATCPRGVCLKAQTDLPELVVGYMIKDRLGQPVFGTNTHHLRRQLHKVSEGTTAVFNFRFAVNLGSGSYSIAVALHTADSHIGRNYEWRDMAQVFNVINVDQDSFVGVAWLPPELELTCHEP